MSENSITLGAINYLSTDPASLASFWARALGGEMHRNGDDVYLAPAGPEGFGMFFHRADASLTPDDSGRAHPDLTVPFGTRREVVDRLVRLGAEELWSVDDEHPHVQWTTMRDPEGNPFCVAEHPRQP
ncbi:VOC family protein [Corynebacterium sp. USCH3]|uniref:VOC family protein n=1 Tax=Corynebacterium sp. USCH3 TaxID=3024840 RepID=UPI0030A66608